MVKYYIIVCPGANNTYKDYIKYSEYHNLPVLIICPYPDVSWVCVLKHDDVRYIRLQTETLHLF